MLFQGLLVLLFVGLLDEKQELQSAKQGNWQWFHVRQ